MLVTYRLSSFPAWVSNPPIFKNKGNVLMQPAFYRAWLSVFNLKIQIIIFGRG